MTRRESFQGGCFVCHGGEARWCGSDADEVAALHHCATGHATWVDVVTLIRYGTERLAEAVQPTTNGGNA